MSLIPAVDDDWVLPFLLGYGENTRKSYASDLKIFFEFCDAADVDHRFATRGVCDAFCRHQIEIVGHSASTVARRLSAVSRYYEYGVSEGHLDKNPAAYVRRPKTGSYSTPLGVSRDELKALLEAARCESPTAEALVSLLSMNGLRVSEALGADFEDLGYERGLKTLKIIRKGGKDAVIPLNAGTARTIDRLQRQYGYGPIFRTGAGNRMNRQGVWRLIRKLAKRAVPERGDDLHPHSLRHGFVTMALEAGCPLHEVQDAAGHSDPRTTQRYNTARNRLENHPALLLGAT